jgi:hypothetical protein
MYFGGWLEVEEGEAVVVVVGLEEEEEPLDLAISWDMSEAKSIFAGWVARWRGRWVVCVR